MLYLFVSYIAIFDIGVSISLGFQFRILGFGWHIGEIFICVLLGF